MRGAIIGDIVGSAYEKQNVRREDFPLFSEQAMFTDDSVLTCAVADVLLHGGHYAEALREYYFRYPLCPYGQNFQKWARSGSLKAYNSFGNGSAMRVSPVAYAFGELGEVLQEAQRCAETTHNHPEGIRGAQAVAAAVFLARTGSSKDEVRAYVESQFGYDLGRSFSDLQKKYAGGTTCQETVPPAMIVFVQSRNFEDCLRKAVSIGGDSDTIASMAGAIAEAFYKDIPDRILDAAKGILDQPLWHIVEEFDLYFTCPAA